jgi:hypothetical protein
MAGNSVKIGHDSMLLTLLRSITGQKVHLALATQPIRKIEADRTIPAEGKQKSVKTIGSLRPLPEVGVTYVGIAHRKRP